MDRASGEEKEKMLTFLNALQSPSHQDEINGYMLSTEHSKDETISSPTKIIKEDAIAPIVVASQNADIFSVSQPPPKTNEERSLEMMKKLAEEVFDPTEDADETVC